MTGVQKKEFRRRSLEGSVVSRVLSLSETEGALEIKVVHSCLHCLYHYATREKLEVISSLGWKFVLLVEMIELYWSKLAKQQQWVVQLVDEFTVPAYPDLVGK